MKEIFSVELQTEIKIKNKKPKSCILGGIWAKGGYSWRVWEYNTRKMFQFLPPFKFGNSISSTQTDTKLLYKKIFLFLGNWQFTHKLGLHLFPTNMLCLKDYPHNLTKHMKSKGPQKHNFWTLYGIGKKSETQTMLIFKNSKFPSFFKNWENWEFQLEEHSKIPKVFVHWEKAQSRV